MDNATVADAPSAKPEEEEEEGMETENLFILGLAVLVGWMLIMLFFARPQLFRNIINRVFCCKKPPAEEHGHTTAHEAAIRRQSAEPRSPRTSKPRALSLNVDETKVKLSPAKGTAGFDPISEAGEDRTAGKRLSLQTQIRA